MKARDPCKVLFVFYQGKAASQNMTEVVFVTIQMDGSQWID